MALPSPCELPVTSATRCCAGGMRTIVSDGLVTVRAAAHATGLHATAAHAGYRGGMSSSRTSARPARSRCSRVGAGSPSSLRRLIQIDGMPSSSAGAMSWK
jgi:hypothetical protein